MAGPDLYSDSIAIGTIRSLAARGDEYAALMTALYDKISEQHVTVNAAAQTVVAPGELSISPITIPANTLTKDGDIMVIGVSVVFGPATDDGAQFQCDIGPPAEMHYEIAVPNGVQGTLNVTALVIRTDATHAKMIINAVPTLSAAPTFAELDLGTTTTFDWSVDNDVQMHLQIDEKFGSFSLLRASAVLGNEYAALTSGLFSKIASLSSTSIKSPVQYKGVSHGKGGGTPAWTIVYGSGSGNVGIESASANSSDTFSGIDGVTQTAVGVDEFTDVVTSGATEVRCSIDSPEIGQSLFLGTGGNVNTYAALQPGDWIVYIGTVLAKDNFDSNGTVLTNFNPVVLGRKPLIPSIGLLDVDNASSDTINQFNLVSVVPTDNGVVYIELSRPGVNFISGVIVDGDITKMLALTPGETQNILFAPDLTIQIGDIAYASNAAPGFLTNIKTVTSGQFVGRVGVVTECGHYPNDGAYCGVFILPYIETKVP